MTQGDRSNSIVIELDATRCLHVRSVWGVCSLCWDSCPSGAIHLDGKSKIPVLDESLCVNCGQCLSACPLDVFSSPHFNERQLLARIEGTAPVCLRCFAPFSEVVDLSFSGEYQLGTCLATLTPGALFELAYERPCELATDRCLSCSLFERLGPTLQCNVHMAYALLADWGREANLRETSPLFLPEPKPSFSFDDGEEGEKDAWLELEPLDGFDGLHDVGLEPLGEPDALRGARFEPASTDAGLPQNPESGAASLQELLADEDTYDDSGVSKIARSVKSSIRSLFHGRRSRYETKEGRQRRGELRLQAKRTHVPFWRQRLEEHWHAHGPTNDAASYPWPELVVDGSLCRACGVCMQLCPTGSIRQMLADDTFTYYFVPGRCIDCGLCIASCAVQALSRAYQNCKAPFEEQVRFTRSAVACKRCGLPVLGGKEGDYCSLCVAEPKIESIMDRIRAQMGVGVQEAASSYAQEGARANKQAGDDHEARDDHGAD